MRAKIALLLSASLLGGALAATAQPLSCASVAPEVRERVREVGACRDATLGDAAPTDAAPAPTDAVTMKLSDGTVVRVPREISSNINDGRKRAATNDTAAPKSAPRAGESAQSEPGASGGPVPALQNLLEVPHVIGRSYADAGSALAKFKIDRIETASAAPAGEVLAQEPAPATLVLPGSTVSLQVSDGALASAADTIPVTAPAAAPPSVPAPAAEPAPATTPAPASEATIPPAQGARFPKIAFSPNAALIFGSGVLLGLLLGALSMRQWLLRRKLVADENAAPPMLDQNQQPVDTDTGGVSETGAAPEIRFVARRDPGETTIALAPLLDGDEIATQHSSDHYA